MNIGSDSETPNPPNGHEWGEVVNNKKVIWIAKWKHPLTGKDTEITFSLGSNVKHLGNETKFDKALELGQYIDNIRINYEKDLISNNNVKREKATILYLIDKYGFRIGNEKDTSKEPDTVGCSTFKSSNVTLDDHTRSVTISFVGKFNVKCTEQVYYDRIYENMKIFKAGKESQDKLFSVKSNDVNGYISSFGHGFTSKNFRTYHASRIYDENLYKYANVTTISFNIKHEQAAESASKFCKHEELKTVIENYIDPRVTWNWCKKHKFSFEDLYNKSTYNILKWAENSSNVSYSQIKI
ncbi:topoisomerase I [Gigaspora margarita]|uniref:DNA topoisomerase 1 n=1 Tax=Gigaspora margarita TaxID=4874 RepID=A0A8H3WTR3_GIGMA|nr:topoisomerase I [Gigaspora margarita]